MSLETLLDAAPDPQGGFNLIVCYYAHGDADKMKRSFLRLLAVQLPGDQVSLPYVSHFSFTTARKLNLSCSVQ